MDSLDTKTVRNCSEAGRVATLAQKMLLIFNTLPLEEALLNAAASDAVTAYLAVFPLIVVGLFKFGAAIMFLSPCYI